MSLCWFLINSVQVLSYFSRVQLFATPWTAACQAPLSMRFSRQEYWSGLPCPPPGDLPDPGIETPSPTSAALAGGFFTTSTTWEAPQDGDETGDILKQITFWGLGTVLNIHRQYFILLLQWSCEAYYSPKPQGLRDKETGQALTVAKCLSEWKSKFAQLQNCINLNPSPPSDHMIMGLPSTSVGSVDSDHLV